MSKVKIVLTKDWNGFKKNDVLERSRDIANIHIKKLKNAKIYVKPKKKTTKDKSVDISDVDFTKDK